ncbi:MAG TPA: molybdopterin-dependent oxidoreductase [Oscillospiraceae bacterium]|nr:molybdopterin-dependent oxidoreductase [Oscillospiraceae bacterium]
MKKVVIVLVILVVIVAITAMLNRDDLGEKVASQENALLYLKADNSETKVDFATMQELPEVEFPAVLKRSGKAPVDTSYAGVELKALLAKLEINTDDKTQIITKAVDGYTVALSLAEVLADDNVYIVYKRDGEDLGTKEDGGSGPYQLVIREDSFGQRWNKYLMEIELQ